MPLDATDLQELADAIKAVGSPATSVNAASIKLPEFWSDDPELWFARVEAQFFTRDIKNADTKFHYIVAALDSATAAEVKPILLHPPADKYEALKSALIDAFAKSQAQKDAELLSISGLGDRKPTALLRKILSLNSDTNTLLRAFFLAQLPTDVRAVLAGQNITDIDDLAKAADRIVESKAVAQTGGINATVNDTTVSSIRNRNARSSAPTKPSSICYFHCKFGSKARSCRPGCLFADLLHSSPSSSSSKPSTSSGNEGAGR